MKAQNLLDDVRNSIETIDRYKQALEKICAIENKMHGCDWEKIEEARQIAKDALEK